MKTTRVAMFAAAILALTLGACGGGSGHGPAPALTFTSVDPFEGSTAGGTEVTIRGSGFWTRRDTFAAIHFAGIAAPGFTVTGDSTITCTTPPGQVGNVNVHIIAKEEGEVLATGGFRYVAPLLWVADGDDPDLANLYFVDLDTGQVRLIGPLGQVIAGMAVSPGGILFGVEEGNLHRLMEIDPTSGEATPTGLLQDQDTGVSYDVRDITFVGDRLIGRTSAGEMVEVDQDFGFITVLHDLTPLVFGDGIAASDPNTVYLAPFAEDESLHVWDPDTLLTSPGPVVSTTIEGTVDALTFRDGMLYALDADESSTLQAKLLRIHPTTGQVSTVADLSRRARAVARVP